MVGVCHVKFGNPNWDLGWVRFPDRLEDTREGSSKLHRLTCDLPVYGVVDTGHAIFGFSDRLSMRRGLWFSRGTAEMWYSFHLSPNTLAESVSGSRTLNPSRTRCHISPRINAVISGVQSNTWDPFMIYCFRDLRGYAGPTCTRMPLSM